LPGSGDGPGCTTSGRSVRAAEASPEQEREPSRLREGQQEPFFGQLAPITLSLNSKASGVSEPPGQDWGQRWASSQFRMSDFPCSPLACTDSHCEWHSANMPTSSLAAKNREGQAERVPKLPLQAALSVVTEWKMPTAHGPPRHQVLRGLLPARRCTNNGALIAPCSPVQ
jgi:hypothetical protein